jgi:siroheme synthase
VKSGKVYLVGAGPGDPGLITVKGLACLKQADVVVYDRLVDENILREARSEAEKI